MECDGIAEGDSLRKADSELPAQRGDVVTTYVGVGTSATLVRDNLRSEFPVTAGPLDNCFAAPRDHFKAVV